MGAYWSEALNGRTRPAYRPSAAVPLALDVTQLTARCGTTLARSLPRRLERILSGLREPPAMLERELDRLLEEIDRYLVAVDGFRALGSEPEWRAELVAAEPERAAPQTRRLSFDVGPH
jgi:hypothetical protein